MTLIDGMELDLRFGWPDGRAVRLARRKKLPHLVLPDGSIRFDAEKVVELIQEVPAKPDFAADCAPGALTVE